MIDEALDRGPFRWWEPAAEGELCGREPEIDRLLASARREGGTARVAAPSGFGVSSLALALERKAGEEGIRCRHLDLWPPASARPALASLRAEAGEDEAGDPPADLLPLPDLLLLDGAERLEEESFEPLRRRLARRRVRGGTTLLFGRAIDPAELPDLHDQEAARKGTSPGPRTTDVAPGPVPSAAWLPFVLERFLETDRWIANRHVERVVRWTGGHPRSTLLLLRRIWSGCAPRGRVRDEDVEAVLDDVLDRTTPTHRARMEGLSSNQRRLLLGLAVERDPAPYSAAFLDRWSLASPSSSQRAVQALQGRALIWRGEDDTPSLCDPLLAAWLRRLHRVRGEDGRGRGREDGRDRGREDGRDRMREDA